MIEIVKTLKVTPEEFYSYIQQSISDQIYEQFGRRVEPEDLVRGYTHKTAKTDKKTGEKKVTKFTIRKAVPNKSFHVLYSSTDYRTEMTYDLVDKDGQTEVTFVQNTEFFNKKEPGRLDQWVLKKRLTGSLAEVEKDIIKKRKQKAKEAEKAEETAETKPEEDQESASKK